jgi:hypothetical protein
MVRNQHVFRGTGAFVLSLAFLLAEPAGPADAKIAAPKRYSFKIDPQTPVKDLLPVAPEIAVATPPWLVKDLGLVPEVVFQKATAIKVMPSPEKVTPEEQEKAFARAMEERDKATEKVAHLLAKINHLNQKGQDHFPKLLLETRPDLVGLPFVMGDACRQGKDRSRGFVLGVSLVHAALMGESDGMLVRSGDLAVEAPHFWASYESLLQRARPEEEPPGKKPNLEETPARVAALMQMLAPMSQATRAGLVKHLAAIDHPDATRALARLAVFSFEPEIRRPAVDALKKRQDDVADLLLVGLRYPWPAVAKNAGEAISGLGRKDLVGQLVAFLDESDPRAPVVKEGGGQTGSVVREVVRLNHHRSCALCHPPANTPDVNLSVFGMSADISTGAVPVPSEPLPSPFQGYNRFASPDIFVRADVTYLRQDFSILLPVKDAAPWPEMQRFDFLVRTRTLTAEEVAAYQAWRKQQGPDYLSPNHQAAVDALRALTGLDAPEPTAKAWRKLLGI